MTKLRNLEASSLAVPILFYTMAGLRGLLLGIATSGESLRPLMDPDRDWDEYALTSTAYGYLGRLMFW